MFLSTSQGPLSGETLFQSTWRLIAILFFFFFFFLFSFLALISRTTWRDQKKKKKRIAFQILEKKDKEEWPFSKHMWQHTNRHLHEFHCSHLRYRIPQLPKLAGTLKTYHSTLAGNSFMSRLCGKICSRNIISSSGVFLLCTVNP